MFTDFTRTPDPEAEARAARKNLQAYGANIAHIIARDVVNGRPVSEELISTYAGYMLQDAIEYDAMIKRIDDLGDAS